MVYPVGKKLLIHFIQFYVLAALLQQLSPICGKIGGFFFCQDAFLAKTGQLC